MEAIQIPQILTDAIGQHTAGGLDEVHTNTRTALADVPVRICKLILIQIEQQAAVMIEYRCSFLQIHCLIIKQQAEVPKMTIRVQDKRIQHKHTP